MVGFSNYIEFVCAGNGADNINSAIYFAISRIIDAVHHYNSRSSTRLAVAFPGYRYDEESLKDCSLGDRVRLFGQQACLKEFLQSDGARSVIFGGLVQPNIQIVETPKPIAHVSYVRVHNEKRTSPQYVLRTEARLRKRMESGRNKLTEEDLLRRRRNLLTNMKGRYMPYVQLTSKTNGNRFSLFIDQRKAPSSSAGQISSYGLSDGSATVPHFWLFSDRLSKKTFFCTLLQNPVFMRFSTGVQNFGVCLLKHAKSLISQ